MRTRMYGGVGGRKTKVGRKLTFVFLLPDFSIENEGALCASTEMFNEETDWSDWW